MGRIVRAARCWTKVSLEVIGRIFKTIQKKFEFAGNVREIVTAYSAARVGLLAISRKWTGPETRGEQEKKAVMNPRTPNVA